MFLLRSSKLSDIEDLYNLSSIVLFINLPPDKTILKSIIQCSIKSFKNPAKDLARNHYLFVLEDTAKKCIVGASLIHGQHGTASEPHFYFTVGQERKFSHTINTGFIHGTLKLGHETNGPTEIGGLVLAPDYRGHEKKLGKQLSFVRFLYMAFHQENFKKTIHSELMPPLDEEGNSPLWEAIGRKFLNMNYFEADTLSRTNKEFILSLFPEETIYVPLLPISARNAIGKVGPDTLPVKKMLEGIGFSYNNEIDPFDGGPHYRAQLEEITPIKNKFLAHVFPLKTTDIDDENLSNIIIALKDTKESFSATNIQGTIKNDKIFLEQSIFDDLKISSTKTYKCITI